MMLLVDISSSDLKATAPLAAPAGGASSNAHAVLAAPARMFLSCCRRRPACFYHDARSGSHQCGGACTAGAWTCGMGLSIRKPLLQRVE